MMKKKNRHMNAQDYILNEDTPFAIREAYKMTRTNLLFLMPGIQCKKILVTSSQQEEGKSSATINLAISMADLGKKVLLIDADLRRPSIDRKLEIESTIGLSEVLLDFNKFDKAIHRMKEGYDVLCAGVIPPNPSELLGSSQMQLLLKKYEKNYDFVFIDTPPVNVVTDAAMLVNAVSGAVVVVRSGQTEKKQVDKVIHNLKNVKMKILGFLLVGSDSFEKDYKYYGE